MPEPGVHVTTLLSPALYSPEQIETACAVAQALNRGQLIVTVPPEQHPPSAG